MEQMDIDPSTMCNAMSLGPVLFPEKLNATAFLHLCHQVNGKVFLIKDEETRQKAAELKVSQPKCAGTKNNTDTDFCFLLTFLITQGYNSFVKVLSLNLRDGFKSLRVQVLFTFS